MQPWDQGIIVSKQSSHLECGISIQEYAKEIDILEALKMVKIAWTNEAAETIRN